MRRERQKAFTVDNRTVADNPGRLRIDYSLFVRCFPFWPVVNLLCILGAAGIAFVYPPMVILALTFGAAFFMDRVRVKEHFWHGCASPAVVVAHAPDLIAVYSDLSTGGEPYPVVKVLRHPLDRMTGGRPPLGTRLATVALFRGAPNRPRWIDFTPIAVNCASSDTAAIERVVAGIRQREWQAMEEALRQVPTPYRPGVYPVKLPPHLIWT